jgi:hypothetical protein
MCLSKPKTLSVSNQKSAYIVHYITTEWPPLYSSFINEADSVVYRLHYLDTVGSFLINRRLMWASSKPDRFPYLVGITSTLDSVTTPDGSIYQIEALVTKLLSPLAVSSAMKVTLDKAVLILKLTCPKASFKHPAEAVIKLYDRQFVAWFREEYNKCKPSVKWEETYATYACAPGTPQAVRSAHDLVGGSEGDDSSARHGSRAFSRVDYRSALRVYAGDLPATVSSAGTSDVPNFYSTTHILDTGQHPPGGQPRYDDVTADPTSSDSRGLMRVYARCRGASKVGLLNLDVLCGKY